MAFSLVAQRFSIKRFFKRSCLLRLIYPLDTVGHGPKETARLATVGTGRRAPGQLPQGLESLGL